MVKVSSVPELVPEKIPKTISSKNAVPRISVNFCHPWAKFLPNFEQQWLFFNKIRTTMNC